MRVSLDANILFSAAKSDGAMRQLVDLLLEAGHKCWADAYVIEQARRNLVAKAPKGVAVLEALLARLHVAAFQAHPQGLEAARALPEKDRQVLAAAIRLGCDALVTGDRTDFGSVYGKRVSGVAIHSPRSLAEALIVRTSASGR